MNQKNKRTLFLTSAICIVLSIVTFILSQMGGASAENYILLYVIALLMNIVLNLALSIKIASTNGAKALVSLGKWIMPIAGVIYLLPQVYSVLFPDKVMEDAYVYVFIGVLLIISGNYFPKNHINPCTSQQKLDTNFKYYLSINLISVQYGASFATFLSG